MGNAWYDHPSVKDYIELSKIKVKYWKNKLCMPTEVEERYILALFRVRSYLDNMGYRMPYKYSVSPY